MTWFGWYVVLGIPTQMVALAYALDWCLDRPSVRAMEAVKKVADALRGRKLAPEVVEAMRGRRHSEETKRLISERALERSRRKREQSED